MGEFIFDVALSVETLHHFNHEEKTKLYKRIRCELGITDGFYHYDTPCTLKNQTQMLYKAGFRSVEKIWQHENTVILLAKK